MKVKYTKKMKVYAFWYYYTIIFMYINAIASVYNAVIQHWGFMIAFAVLTWVFWWLHKSYSERLAEMIVEQIAKQK